MATLAEGDDARLVWYTHQAHGTGPAYRICTITAPGLYSETLTSEQVAENLEKIMDPTGYIVPAKSMDQYQLLKLN